MRNCLGGSGQYYFSVNFYNRFFGNQATFLKNPEGYS